MRRGRFSGAEPGRFHTASVPNWRTQQRSRVKEKVSGLMKGAGTADHKTNGYLWEWEVDRGSWGKMICGHHSCYRHGAETWDRIKTTQALIVCLETDLLELRKQQWPLKKYSPFSYQRSYFYNPRRQLGVCVRVCTCMRACALALQLAEADTLAGLLSSRTRTFACVFFWQSCVTSCLSSSTNHDHLENTYFIYHKHIIEKYMTETAWNHILLPWGHLAPSNNLSSKTPLKTQRSFRLTAPKRRGIPSADMPDCHLPSLCVCMCVCVSLCMCKREWGKSKE